MVCQATILNAFLKIVGVFCGLELKMDCVAIMVKILKYTIKIMV
jgi:hypothetical protein